MPKIGDNYSKRKQSNVGRMKRTPRRKDWVLVVVEQSIVAKSVQEYMGRHHTISIQHNELISIFGRKKRNQIFQIYSIDIWHYEYSFPSGRFKKHEG